MVFVRVREHDAGEVLALLDQIADVGQDQIDARQMLFAGERHAEIDGEPLRVRPSPEAVDRQIHADLADAAERREHQFLFRLRHAQAPPKPEHFAGGDGRKPVRPAQQQPSRLVEPFKAAGEFAFRQPHADVLAEPGGAREPIGADRREPSPRCHCASRRCIAGASAVEQTLRRDHARRPAARSVAG